MKKRNRHDRIRGEHLYFKVLTDHISRKTFTDYINCFGKLEGIRREYADIILDLIISANQEEVKHWKEDEKMCQAMRMIMEEELDEEREQGISQGIRQGMRITKQVMRLSGAGLTVDEIAEEMQISREEVMEILEE